MTNNPRIPPKRPGGPHVVELLAFPGVQLLDVTGPLQVFASANEALQAARRPPLYDIRLVARSESVATSSGIVLSAQRAGRGPVGTLMVAGGGGVHAAARDRALLSWLERRASRARRIASVCTGAWLLAAAGLLDGKRTATHWADCEALARAYPKARVESEPIFLQDGRIWTSAGVTSGIDMALAMVEADAGHAIAIAVARDLVVFLKRPGGQSQFSATLELQKADAGIDRLHAWVANNLCADLSVPALAARAGLSERTFVRRHVAATGQTPARAVDSLRVEAARQLLATTALPVKRVAARCGFGSEETMRRSLLRKVGISPGEYRARFSAARRK